MWAPRISWLGASGLLIIFQNPHVIVIDSVTVNTCRHIQQGERGVSGDPGNPGVKGEKVRTKILFTFVTHVPEFSPGAFVTNSSHPKP